LFLEKANKGEKNKIKKGSGIRTLKLLREPWGETGKLFQEGETVSQRGGGRKNRGGGGSARGGNGKATRFKLPVKNPIEFVKKRPTINASTQLGGRKNHKTWNKGALVGKRVIYPVKNAL